MLYNENMVFGVGAIDIKTVTGTVSVFAGQETGAKTSASASKAIDIGKATGVYKDQYYARINVVEPLAGNVNVTFTFHFINSETSTTDLSSVTLTVPASVVNEAKRTPLEVSLPSVAGRFCRLEVGADGAVGATGAVIVAIEPTRW